MRDSLGAGGEPAGAGREPAGAERESDDFGGLTALRMAPNITAAEATAVFRRKLPGAHVDVHEVLHPFWWTVLAVETRGIFGRRRAKGSGQRINVLVNAQSGKGFLADFEPRGTNVDAVQWRQSLDSQSRPSPVLDPADVTRAARSLVRAKVLKTVKLGMGISIAEVAGPRGVLKPNWLVSGANAKYSATILVDGLDSSHYIVRVEKTSAD
ncbi:hypothetical protein [Brevibacterium sp.]|uniref:hypothetical protein n=1 Tax=Brevibacterium sp. TaxID=1701 RepID=UPI002810C0BE|nr:hypothetical protein [Brevibacterium sp.]